MTASTQVLQVGLDTAGQARVVLRLVTDAGGSWSESWSTEATPSEIGVPTRVDGGRVEDSRFQLPARVADELPAHLVRGRRSTWLQLIEPFGYLGMVPWERLLAGVVPGAIVRLPSIDIAARAPTEDLRVALLAIAPDPDRPGAVRERMHGAWLEAGSMLRAWTPGESGPQFRLGAPRQRRPPEARLTAADVEVVTVAVLRGSPRRTTIHVITTPWIYHELRARWAGRGWPVRLHDPHEPIAPAGRGQPGGWLGRACEVLDGEQADIVHLLCHGDVVGTSVRLLLADTVDDLNVDTSRFVSWSHLRTFLDTLGAWSLHLTSPPGDPSPAMLRLAVSRVSERRPGPVVFTDLAADPTGSDIRSAYRFVCGAQPAWPPRLPRAIIACEPHRVRDGAGVVGGPHISVTAPAATTPAPAIAAVIHSDHTPAWVAATQRFIEQRQLELARLQRDAPVGSSTPEARSRAAGIEEAIATLAEVVADYTDDAGRTP